MPAIKNTKKTLVEWLSLKQESVKDKLLLERIGMNPTPSIEPYDKLVEADPCWHKVDNLYFSSCPPELHFCHDLANWLSHYLYFFSFLFLFTTTRWSTGKYHMTLSQCHNGMMDGHRWSGHSHSVSHDESNMRTMGEQVHSHSSKVYK